MMSRLVKFFKAIAERFWRSPSPGISIPLSTGYTNLKRAERVPEKLGKSVRVVIHRTDFTDTSTIGVLMLDGLFFCYTLEDTCRRKKVCGKTAIWSGEYALVAWDSPRFGRVPKLLDVPEFTDILIHAGNTDADTKGCILVGREKARNVIHKSREAFNGLMPRMEKFWKEGPCRIAVIGGPEYDPKGDA